jgi:hypothetical protein
MSTREGIGWLARLRCLVATRLGSGAHGAAVATAAERLRCPERREGGRKVTEGYKGAVPAARSEEGRGETAAGSSRTASGRRTEARTYSRARSGARAGGQRRLRGPSACVLPREGTTPGEGAPRATHSPWGRGPTAPCVGSKRRARATSRRRGVTSAG